MEEIETSLRRERTALSIGSSSALHKKRRLWEVSAAAVGGTVVFRQTEQYVVSGDPDYPAIRTTEGPSRGTGNIRKIITQS